MVEPVEPVEVDVCGPMGWLQCDGPLQRCPRPLSQLRWVLALSRLFHAGDKQGASKSFPAVGMAGIDRDSRFEPTHRIDKLPLRVTPIELAVDVVGPDRIKTARHCR
jgi:hypothetical protein